ncbi:hypothetical protein ABPG75_005200 [Micractinium tetrahymenae]
MRVLAKPGRRQRHSLAGPAALVLALVCLVQLHLLLRPGRRHTSADDDLGWHSSTGGSGQHPDGGGGRTQQAALHEPGAALHVQSQELSPPEAAAAGLARIRGAPIAFVSFANGAFNDFLANWVASIRRLGLPFVVGALDDKMAETAAARGWPHLLVGSAAATGGDAFFRANFTAFRGMGAKKVQLVLTMLERYEVQTIMVSDSDTTWLRDPSDYLAKYPQADWFMSTDCLSHQVEVEWQPRHNQPRCGHVAGNAWGRSFNTGIFAVRNREAGKAVLRKWRDALLDNEHTHFTVVERATGKEKDLGITDQVALNRLLDYQGLMPATQEEPRVLLLLNETLRLHPLPVLLFASGHVAFVQRLPWKFGQEPYVVHATFQRFPTSLHRQGKRARFREMGMWFLDPPEYFDPPGGGRYLTYTNGVRDVVAAVERERHGGAMPVLYKHMVAVSYQLAIFRDALAAAVMLNRTVVLAKSWCWCDYDWTPHVLEKCKIRGSDTVLPFECPSDFIFNIPFFEDNALPFRMPNFLEMPQVPVAVRRFQADLHMLPQRPAAVPGDPSGAVKAITEGKAPISALWPQMSQAELEAEVAPVSTSAVLAIKGMQPGLLVGFADRAAGQRFEALWQNITMHHMYWCCAAELGQWSAFKYELPKPLTSGYTPWEPPTLELPKWCADIAANERQREYVFYTNHPCQFLTNTTAAAIAASYAVA